MEDDGESEHFSKRSICNRLFLVLLVAYRLMEGRTIYMDISNITIVQLSNSGKQSCLALLSMRVVFS